MRFDNNIVVISVPHVLLLLMQLYPFILYGYNGLTHYARPESTALKLNHRKTGQHHIKYKYQPPATVTDQWTDQLFIYHIFTCVQYFSDGIFKRFSYFYSIRVIFHVQIRRQKTTKTQGCIYSCLRSINILTPVHIHAHSWELSATTTVLIISKNSEYWSLEKTDSILNCTIAWYATMYVKQLW